MANFRDIEPAGTVSPVMNSPETRRTSSDTLRRRSARSRDGCLTCKRRKVRCNEQKPRCSHCERLNLECTWKTIGITRRNSNDTSVRNGVQSGFSQSPSGTELQHRSNIGSNGRSPSTDLSDLANLVTDPSNNFMFMDSTLWADFQMPSPLDHQAPQNVNYHIDLGMANMEQSPLNLSIMPADEIRLVEEFLQMGVPPILEPIETGPLWVSARALFLSWSTSSPMVRLAIMAFSAVRFRGPDISIQTDHQPFYERAGKELSRTQLETGRSDSSPDRELQYVLATLFLLAYTDLLTGRGDMAHANLKEAHTAIQRANKDSFGAAEKRLISWIRLIDARAVSAGGEGLFLDDKPAADTEIKSSPTTTGAARTGENMDAEIEEILFDMLYRPGILFFQKVQSIMGRITKLDRWHRSRGTVESETEVMMLAAAVSKDLDALYEQRPALMDHAVAGNISERLLAKNLVLAMTRSFRTYLANYWACYVHLHRVAYRHLPRTQSLINALQEIKTLLHLMADSQESLPVNLLWPLLMWGSEEDDLEERAWILNTIRSLKHIATNAQITADLLEAVQKRQDQMLQRADIREVSQEIFSACFAIV